MLPELDLDIPELDIELPDFEDIDLTILEDKEFTEWLNEPVLVFDLAGIDEQLAELISDEELGQIDADLIEWLKGVDDLVLDFPEIELINLDGGGYEL